MPQAYTSKETGEIALVALGSNVNSAWGDPRETIQKSMLEIGVALGGALLKSEFYETPAFPAGAGPDFVNAAIRVRTALGASSIMTILHEIEAMAGRERVMRWGQRTLDLDLIGLGDAVLPDGRVHQYWRDLPIEEQVKTAPDQLVVPHPRVQDRSFVLVPLADVAPDWVHPVLGLTVMQMRDARPSDEIASVSRI